MHTLLIADDHALFREGLRGIVERWNDFQLIGEAENGLRALELARELLPDIVLMDINMPEFDGLQATTQIAREIPAVKIVVLTASEEEDDLFKAIKAGARGYVLKDMPSSQLHSMLQGVLQGEVPISGVMAAKMIEEFNRPWQDNAPGLAAAGIEALTEREQQVLDHVAQGLTNQEIGLQLHLTENTIKKYLHNIMEKLHLNNRVEAALYAVKQARH
jgi:DNA-binding NarL/FixJ family response regulator